MLTFDASYAQTHFWTSSRRARRTQNVSICFDVRGPLDASALERALNAIVARHESLRTVLTCTGGRVQQVVLPRADVRLQRRRLCNEEALDDSRCDAVLHTIVAEPFDAERGPLLRAALVERGPHDTVLVLVVCHLVFDRWSAIVFLEELGAAYDASVTGGAPTQRPLRVQYRTFAAEQHQWFQSVEYRVQLAYWESRLTPAPPELRLYRNGHDPLNAGTTASYTTFSFSREATAQMVEAARRHRVTPFILQLAAFMILLNHYAAEEDLCVLSPIACRRRLEWQPLIGFLMNTVLIRARVRKSDCAAEIIRRVRHAALGAYECQEVPFRHVIRLFEPDTLTGVSQIAFHNAPRSALALSGLDVVLHVLPETIARRHLTMSTFEDRSHGAYEWDGDVVYNADLFDAGQIATLVAGFKHVLGRIAETPDASAAAITDALSTLDQAATLTV